MRTLLLILLLSLLTACTTTGGAEPTAAPPTDEPVAEPEPTLDGVLTYQKSGGFAGVEEAYTIYEDGRIFDKDGNALEEQTDLAPRLFADVADLGFYEMNTSYVPENSCCDRFLYTITVSDDGREHTVSTLDDAPGEPVELRRLIAKINFILFGE